MTHAAVQHMIEEAEKHSEDMAKDRARALEYYRGEMKDTPADDGRSKVVVRVLRKQIKKVLPSIVRTLLGSFETVEYQPNEEGDEESAEQASDYVNYVVLSESGAKRSIKDAVEDALQMRNGILKAWYDERTSVKYSRHTGLTEEALGALAGSDDVDVLENNERVEEVEGIGPVTFYDVKIRRRTTKGRIRAAAVPRERFIIHPDAVTTADALVVGEKSKIRRSELVEMGYPRDVIDALPLAGEDESDSLRQDREPGDEVAWANQEVDYYDLYVRHDEDDDGIAELRHMVFAGGLKEENLLENEEVDEVQFYDIKVMSQSHQWEGISLADDLLDIQQIETVLLRQALDNVYWANNPQPVVDETRVSNIDAVLNPEFGQPIFTKGPVRDAVTFSAVPFVAKDSFAMLSYFEEEAEGRTGITDASSGLAPDALQNMTAKASAMIEQMGIGQTELLVETIAEGLEHFFRGILRLVVKHQDVPRTVRLRDEWVQFDPRQWNAELDCTVNTGLGAGTRERDMAMMMMVKNVQAELFSAFGPDNPFVSPENLANTLEKTAEAAGLKTPSLYFTRPDPEEIKARLEVQKNQPSEAQMKLEAQREIEQMKQQTQAAKEKAQMEADLIVKRAEIEADTQKQAAKLAADAAIEDKRIAWEREKLERELQFKAEESSRARQDEIWKAQAAGFQPFSPEAPQ